MPLYRLEPAPAYIYDEDWSASTHKTLVYVEADSEKEARKIAHRAFWIAADRKSDGRVPENPWKNPDMVLCYEVDHIPEGVLMLRAQDIQ
ncbi:hypothetical protein [Thalassospira profundimaris]|uniref:Uncharacterized protein n=1 Tax=Thalassospira profundimaris TaxID=502049 RepID=A0A367WRL0_9PROT|nr:hypothetical protein [Thalassospira profundimaris]RCK43240.1 hypothetical protein TH30_19700 [Thalassospira profundimaris]